MSCLHTALSKIFVKWLQAEHDDILTQQDRFDELTERAQTLLQSTTDSRLTSQLAQLSTRYTATMATSKVTVYFFMLCIPGVLV